MSIQTSSADQIRINDLTLAVPLLTGASWQLEAEDDPVEQPISISLSVFHDVAEAAHSDDLSHTIDYAEISREIKSGAASKSFVCIQDLSAHICSAIGSLSSLKSLLDGLQVYLKVTQLKSPLHSKAIAIEHSAVFSADGSWSPRKITHHVEDLTCATIIGVNVAERLEKQDVVVNVTVDTGDKGLDRDDWIDLRALTRLVYEEIDSSEFVTLESLTSHIASETLSVLKSYQPSPVVSVRISKPAAIPLAKSAEIHITRTFADFPDQAGISPPVTGVENATTLAEQRREDDMHTAAIALGSNLGDSLHNIEYALRLLEIPREILGDEVISLDLDPTIAVVNTSFLYETAPMYVTDQPSFINCACVVETNLSSRTLLRVLKEIESIVGRIPTIRHGPRAVDLDIIFYDEHVVDTRSDTSSNLDDVEGELIVPHPRMQEREFVLRPLNDMIPEYVHPVSKKTIATLLKEVHNPTTPSMKKVIPFPRLPLSPLLLSAAPYPSIPPVPETLAVWSYTSIPNSHSRASRVTKSKSNTHIMGTLNVTPDSFSDGSRHDTLPAALRYVYGAVAAGATVIDIGGYSTRPGAAFVSPQEEIARVVPAVQAMRDESLLRSILSQGTESTAEDEDGPSSAATPAAVAFSDEVIKRVLNTPISVDTFRPEVAHAALKAGANCINDVYAFTGPDAWPSPSPTSERGKNAADYMEKMKAITRECAVPVILMHSRGDAGKEKDYGQYAYAEPEGGLTLEGVRVELGRKVDEIVLGKGGVRRWLVIADPGIGFSKTLEGNLEVLRGASEVVADIKIGGIGSDAYRNPLAGYPQLIGVSRKSFLGVILSEGSEGRETRPDERTWATAAGVTCAVQQGALIVRVHDVKQMADVVRVADALWL
ncbi:Dihydropteroate synthase-like protein [Gymnopilus junonius]|uniref:Dihydropteroate synthase-like protein n=1 Tax=Gymnopilus junonius TaxID=109634 RepID=A0A9P5NMT8_GYMJU|nr:Dihydropteroate synthase-like protein [Gymnopilus junonius]